MNREQQKKAIKELQKAEFAKVTHPQENNTLYFDEGAKVKLNYNRMISSPDYENLTSQYKDFIEQNKNKILTVLYDDLMLRQNQNKPLWITFEEDTNPVKWLFCVHDLIAVEDNNNEKQ